MTYWSVLSLVGVVFLIALYDVALRRRVRDRTSLLEREIAARRLADYQLVTSEQSLRAILSASPAGICSMKNQICQWANEAMARITGYSADELQGKTSRFLYKNDAEYDRAERSLDNEGVFEAQWIRKDGALRDVSIRVGREDGETHVRIVEDVTGRKEAEKRLRLSEQRFRLLFELARDAIVILKEGIFADCNEKTLALFGCQREEIVGRPIIDFSPPLQPDGTSFPRRELRGRQRRPFSGPPSSSNGDSAVQMAPFSTPM